LKLNSVLKLNSAKLFSRHVSNARTTKIYSYQDRSYSQLEQKTAFLMLFEQNNKKVFFIILCSRLPYLLIYFICAKTNCFCMTDHLYKNVLYSAFSQEIPPGLGPLRGRVRTEAMCFSLVLTFFRLFTREYTKCTAGSTFCFVVVVVVLGKPLIKLASISADS
jgi:hypothetical protein